MCPDDSHPAPVEVEVDNDEADSTYDGGSSFADSTSLGSSILRHQWKHGRRYHSYQAGAYNFPNDDREQERLDMVHHAYCRTINDRLFLAPIQLNGKTVLDIGTGTGIWSIDLADEYPSAFIVGNDLSPIQPSWVPPNVKFIVDDVEEEWVEVNKYDFVHCRYMGGSIKNWPRLMSQIYASLKPGGWVEFQETANTLYSEDNTLKPDYPILQLMNGLLEACEKIGRTLDPAPHFAGWSKDAGFTNVSEQRFKLPIGSWPRDPRLKEIGTLLGINFLEGVDAFTSVLFADVLGWPREHIELLNASVRRAAQSRDVHSLLDFVVVLGQKPE